MNTKQKNARIVGVLYLIVAITGGFAHFSVRESLIVPNDLLTTAFNITSSETLFRIGSISDIICQTIFIFVPLYFYNLLKKVNKNYAITMVILALIGIPIAFMNIILQLGALELLVNNNYLIAFGEATLHALIMLLLDLNGIGILIVQIFWGLWLLPLGLLVFQSGFLPRIIGIMLIIAAFIYSFGSVATILLPQHMLLFDYIYWQPAIVEIVLCLWLLIIGIRPKQTIRQQSMLD